MRYSRAMHIWRLLLVLTLSLGASACTKRAPWAGEGTNQQPCYPDGSCDPGLLCAAGTCIPAQLPPDAGPHRDGPAPKLDVTRPDMSDGCPNPPTMAPKVDPLPATTPHAKVVLRGQAPSGSVTIVASLGNKRFNTPVVNGIFCLEADVPEVAQPITYTVVAIDGQGCRSQEATATTRWVKADGAKNVLAGLLGAGTHTQGPFTPLTDGKLDKWTEFSFYDPDIGPGGTCDRYAYLRYELPTPARIDRVVVKYPTNNNFKNYLQCYRLMGSSTIAVPQQGGWTDLAYDDKGQRGDLEITVNNPTPLRHLILLMYEDGGTGYNETFQLVEIEAWSSGEAPPFVGCN